MSETIEAKTKGSMTGDHEAQRAAITASMARARSLRFAREALFDAQVSMAAIRRSKTKI